MNTLSCYTFYAKSRDGIKGGGVAAFISAEYDVQELKLNINNISFECLILDINLKSTQLKLTVAYRPPSSSICACIKEFTILLDKLRIIVPKQNSLIFARDFNIGLIKINVASSSDFVNLVYSNLLFPPITFPTLFNNRVIKCPIVTKTMQYRFTSANVNKFSSELLLANWD